MKVDIAVEFRKKMKELQKQITTDTVSDFIPEGSRQTNNQRKYPDGKPIDPKLPKNYKQAKSYRKCVNCGFYNKKNCQKFNAEVKSNYVCRSWKQRGTI